MSLTGLKDIDREILKYVDKRELLKVCSINRKMWNEICDDSFLRRLLRKYEDVEKYKRNDQTWKIFFAQVVYYIKIMKDNFAFQYTGGDFIKQANILKSHIGRSLLYEALKQNDLSLLKHSFKQIKVNIEYERNYALRISVMDGNIEMIKYLIECGVDIHLGENFPLRSSVYNRHLDIVKYLISKGADIHARSDEALQTARENQDSQMIEYLNSLQN